MLSTAAGEIVPLTIDGDDWFSALRKRPAVPQELCPPELIRRRPEFQSALDEDHLNKNFRSSKKGEAGGPSGMTVEHLQPLLDHPRDLQLVFQVAERLARAAIRMGSCGRDVVRRLVACTMSQQLMDAVQQATAPFFFCGGAITVTRSESSKSHTQRTPYAGHSKRPATWRSRSTSCR